MLRINQEEPLFQLGQDFRTSKFFAASDIGGSSKIDSENLHHPSIGGALLRFGGLDSLFRGPVGQDMSEAGAGIRTRPSANTRSNITVL